ncbi:hypothetical protein quinque_009221 [Culex quinquefasciatus]
MAYLPAVMAGTAIANLLGGAGKNEDVGRLDSKVDANQREQSQFNYKMAEMVSGQGQQLKTMKLNTDRISSLTDKLSDRQKEAFLQLGRVQSDTSGLRRDQDRFGTRLDQFQSDQSSFNTDIARKEAGLARYQLLSASTVRNEERQLGFMNSQTSLNEKLLNRTDALTDKYFATEGKLDLMNHRADSLQDGQAKIADDLKQEKQIHEARLRDQFKHNETLSNNYTRVEERQNCFISDQKSRNEQITNQTENIRDKLGKTSHNVDFVNFRVDTLQAAQQKLDNEQKDMDKRLHVVEHCSDGFRDEQKQMNEMLKNLLAAVTEIGARMKTMESRLDFLQAGYERVNAMCIKFEASGGSFGKGPDEVRNDLNCGTNDVTSVNNMLPM